MTDSPDPAPDDTPAIQVWVGAALRASLTGDVGGEGVVRLRLGSHLSVEPSFRYSVTTGNVFYARLSAEDYYYVDTNPETYRQIGVGVLVRAHVARRGPVDFDVLLGGVDAFDIWVDRYSGDYDYGYETAVLGVDVGGGATYHVLPRLAFSADLLNRTFEDEKALINDNGTKQETNTVRWGVDPGVRLSVLLWL